MHILHIQLLTIFLAGMGLRGHIAYYKAPNIIGFDVPNYKIIYVQNSKTFLRKYQDFKIKK